MKNSSPLQNTSSISIDGNSPSVCVSASSPVNHEVVEGQRQTTFLQQADSAVRTNGHMQGEESGSSRAKFELRAFQEERRPAKLFSPGEEQQVRVTRRRPSEEVKSWGTKLTLVCLEFSLCCIRHRMELKLVLIFFKTQSSTSFELKCPFQDSCPL